MTHQLWSVLIKHKLSPNLIYFLDCCRQKIMPSSIVNGSELKREAIENDLISIDGTLSVHALLILEEFETFLVKSKKKVTGEVLGEDFLNNVKTFRQMFPARKLPSRELARQSVQELRDKFVWFFKTFPEYSWDLVLDATDYYIYTKSKENYMYMSTSSYFIQKVDARTKTWKSVLADHCQMIQENPEILNHP
jgi:hypothetical protein